MARAAKEAIEKTKEALEEYTEPHEDHPPEDVSNILYDARKSQTIPWAINDKFRVSHTLAPLTNERYFQLQEELLDVAKKNISSSNVFDPKMRLWRELAESVEGYGPTPDWKEKMFEEDAIAAINVLTFIEPLDEDDEEPAEFVDLDAATRIPFRAQQGNALLELSHSFKRPSRADKDEYFAIEAGEPNRNQLASAEKKSVAERLYHLGKRLLVERTGYVADSPDPAWHLAQTVGAFFIKQNVRMGMSLRRSSR